VTGLLACFVILFQAESLRGWLVIMACAVRYSRA
jgi:hypothetical protein